MTLYEQLAQQWHKSISEVKIFEKQVNEAFLLDVQKMSTDNKWHGILWQYDLHHRPFVVISTKQSFDQAPDAAEHLNSLVDQFRLSPLMAQALEWPADIYRLVHKLQPQQFEKYPVARPLNRMPVIKSQKTYA